MKKHLIAAAVAAAVAVPAMAQNVTVYGRLDAGYRDTENKSGGAVTTATSGIGYNAFTTSRFGLTGTEDLGGGLKAGFTIEGNVHPSGGSTGSNGTTDFNFGRHSFLTLSGGFGTILAGKTDSMVKAVFDTYDAGYSNNMTGAFDSLAGGAGIVGNRRDATVRYTSNAMSGLSLSAGVMEASSEAAGGVKSEDNNGYEVGARYAAGKLSLAAAYRDADSKTGTTANTNVKTTALGASYDLGAVVLFGQYFDQSDKNKVANTKTDLDAFAIGARLPMGATTFFASYTDGESKVGATKTDLKGMQVGLKHDLSKRTYAYVVYGDREEETGAAKVETKDVAIGIAHHF